MHFTGGVAELKYWCELTKVFLICQKSYWSLSDGEGEGIITEVTEVSKLGMGWSQSPGWEGGLVPDPK